jgi:uncharacterized membrane protein YeaQ/YmgE (transglycosylase-associated protein family)
MTFVTFAMWVGVGLLAGSLAGFVLKHGGYGLSWDMILGLAGSIAVSWVFHAIQGWPGAGLGVVAIVAFIGAAIPIVVQRQVWPTAA